MTQHNNIDPYFSFKCAVASFFANYAVGVFHPLELLKTRFQSHDGKAMNNLVPKYQGIINGIKHIYRVEGMSGLFKGIHLTTFTSAAASALFFWIYEKSKLYYEQNDYKIMSAAGIASLYASILTTLLTQPFWVVKTRVLLNTEHHVSEYSNIKSKSVQIWRQHGLRGFYLGLNMNLLLSFTGALQIYLYQGSKILYESFLHSSNLGQKNFICGAFSKLISTVATYPLTTVRTRVQQNQYIQSQTERKYQGELDVSRKILKQQGMKGFFKGLGTNLLRGIPHRGVYFYFYELFKKWLIITDPKISPA